MAASKHSYDIFISHSYKDERWVKSLAQKLTDLGLSVFIFEDEIKPGQSIPAQIANVLESVQYVFFVMTEDWVNSEWSSIEMFSALFADPNNRQLQALLLYLKDCNIPYLLRTLRYIDFRNKKDFSKNFKTLILELRDLIYERYIIHTHSVQSKSLLNQSMLPWTIHGGPSVGFIIPELFIDPKVQTIKYPLTPSRFKDWLSIQKDIDQRNIAIVGLPGIGKSTLSKKIFLDCLNIYKGNDTKRTPVYCTVRDLLEYIQTPDKKKSLGQFVLRKFGIIPFLLGDEHYIYVIDGLDEIEANKGPQIIAAIQANLKPEDILWITSRKEFFFSNLKSDEKFYSLFHDILEIQEWGVTDSLQFADDYSRKYNDRNIFIQLKRATENSENKNIGNFLKKPFELTLLLYLFSSEDHLSKNIFESSYTLYKAFYDHWLQREDLKKGHVFSLEETRRLHQLIATELYNRKGNPVQLVPPENNAIPAYTASQYSEESSFWDLLQTSTRSGKVFVERFWHETFGEYVIAENLLHYFLSGDGGSSSDLRIIYNNEINVFIRQGFLQLNDKQKQIVYHNLAVAYFNTLCPGNGVDIQAIGDPEQIPIGDIDNRQEAIRIREQIIYYIGRLEVNFYPSIFDIALKHETDVLIRRSAVLGCILHNNESVESAYIESLQPGTPEDIKNRSVQLVYFGDAQGDLHTYIDNNTLSWEKTRYTILERLDHDGKRDLSLRWWDLQTLFCFLQSRNWQTKLSKAQFQIIEKAGKHIGHSSPERNAKIKSLVDYLCNTLTQNNDITS